MIRPPIVLAQSKADRYTFTVVTIGLSLTIPLALLGSLILPNTSSESITLFSLLGAGLVFIGFGMLGWQGWKETQAIDEEGVGATTDLQDGSR